MSGVRWGVLSTANIGRHAVVPAIRRSCNGDAVAVASRDADRAASFADDLGIPRAHGRYEDLLADPEVDAVYNPLPNSLHREWTLKALAAGKPVLCEKPLGLTAVECLEMNRAAEQSGLALMEAFMYRFHPQIERALGLLAEGAIGAPRLIRASFSFQLKHPDNIRFDPALGGGSLLDVGCYCVNVARTLAGGEPVEAQAWARWGGRGVDVGIAGQLRFPDGLLAQFDSALDLPRREHVEVVGDRGSLELPIAFLSRQRDKQILVHAAQARTLAVPAVDEYRLMVEHVADCVLNGTPVRYPAAEAAANLRAIEALYRSARDGGKPQPIPPS